MKACAVVAVVAVGLCAALTAAGQEELGRKGGKSLPTLPVMPVPPPPNTLGARLQAEFPAYTFGAAHDVHSLLSLECAREAEGQRDARPPVALTVVIDESGSMTGDKIRLVKKTTEFIATQLTAKDKLGVVAYNSQVREVMPLTSMTDLAKQTAIEHINEVEAGGSTNISDGLLKGIEQLADDVEAEGGLAEDEDEQQEAVRTVFLLTDGMANHGITDPAEMESTMVKALQDIEGGSRIRVFTFGYGANHDMQLLGGLAEAGGGDYFFIEGEADLPRSFGGVLGGLLTTNCQDVEVELTPEAGVAIEVSTGSLEGKATEASDGAVKMRVGDLFAEERKDLVIQLGIEELAAQQAQQVLCHVSIRYRDVLLKHAVDIEMDLSVARPATVPADQKPSVEVMFHRTRLETVAKIKEAKAAADNAGLGLPVARQVLQAFILEIEDRRSEAEAQGADQKILDGYDGLKETVEIVIAGLRDRFTYNSGGSFVAFSVAEQTDQQRFAPYAPAPPASQEFADMAAAFVASGSP